MDYQVEDLWQLQEIKKKYFKLKEEMDKLNNLPRIELLEEKLAAAQKELNSTQKRLRLLAKSVKSKEMDCEKLSLKKKSIQEELYRGNASAKELSNLQQQLERTGVELEKSEEEALSMTAEIEDLMVKEAKLQKQVGEMEKSLSVESANKEVRLQEIQQEMGELKSKYERLEKEINPKILKIYRKKFNQFSVSTIAEVAKGICTGCNIHLPRYIILEAKKRKTLVTCENCGRILYYRF